ncbi:MAG: RBBP9/YdeN family alpha/beta hydrolase [Nanoarchaeota archaeon]
MATLFIIHGAYGNPQENWFPWLKSNLEAQGHTVYTPTFPTPKGQTLSAWKKAFEPYQKFMDSNTIMIGHSLAPAFILSLLETYKARACFFVSGFIGLLDNNTFDPINTTFVCKDFDWDTIKRNCPDFFLYHADNDPYVPLEKSREFAFHLNTTPHIIEGGGHFNADAGYLQFPLLLKDIEALL